MKRNERISTIMSTEPVTVHVHQSLGDVQQVMAEGRFHHVPVVSGKKVVGIISATDLTRASYEYGVDHRQAQSVLDHTRSISDVMQQGVVTVKASDTIRHATEILANDWFHALPVVDDQEDLVGIITTTDVLKYLLEQY
jgi:CBS domain-containing protein